jgi:hypothetical protein
MFSPFLEERFSLFAIRFSLTALSCLFFYDGVYPTHRFLTRRNFCCKPRHTIQRRVRLIAMR